MTALTADRNTPVRDGNDYNYPVVAADIIFMGALVCLDSSGNAQPGATATGLIAVGRADEYVDNSAGAAAAKTVKVRSGVFRWANGDSITKAHIGDTAYVTDDQTVAKLGTGKSPAGIIVDVDSLGVWVETRPEVAMGTTGLVAANNLSDVGTVATARSNLGLDTGDNVEFSNVTASGTLAVTGLATATAGIQPGPGTAGILKTRKTSVTAAQLKALAATPITVIPAVAGKMHVPIGFHLKLEYGSEVLVEPSAPDEPQFKYVDGSGVACSATLDAGEIIVAAADAYAYAPGIQVEGGTLAEHVNVPIVLHNTGGEYTGNASNDTVLEVTATYMELDVS